MSFDETDPSITTVYAIDFNAPVVAANPDDAMVEIFAPRAITSYVMTLGDARLSRPAVRQAFLLEDDHRTRFCRIDTNPNHRH